MHGIQWIIQDTVVLVAFGDFCFACTMLRTETRTGALHPRANQSIPELVQRKPAWQTSCESIKTFHNVSPTSIIQSLCSITVRKTNNNKKAVLMQGFQRSLLRLQHVPRHSRALKQSPALRGHRGRAPQRCRFRLSRGDGATWRHLLQ